MDKVVVNGVLGELAEYKRELEKRLATVIDVEIQSFREITGVTVTDLSIDLIVTRRVGNVRSARSDIGQVKVSLDY